MVSRIQGTRPEPEPLQEDQFRLLFDGATDAIVIGAVEGTIVAVNPACERLIGFAAAELVGRDAFDFVAPEWREVTHRELERELSEPGGTVRLETVLVDSAGARIPVDVSSALLVSEGRLVGAQAIVRDLRPRQRIEAALRESEERFRSAFDAAPVGMALVSVPDGRLLQVNRALCALTGHASEDLLGSTIEDITHPEDYAPNMELLHRLLAGELERYELEKRYVRKDGEIVWGLLSASVVRGGDGQPLYLVGQVQDITARKRIELAAAAFRARNPGANSLSPREREVLACLARGMTSGGVAAELLISVETVETHVRRAMSKLGAKTRTQAVASALLLGFLEGRLETL